MAITFTLTGWSWMVFCVAYAADAYVYHALVATEEGVVLLNTSSGRTEAVLPMEHGAGGVDFHVGRREVYAIMYTNRNDTSYIVRVKEVGKNTDLQNWCSIDTDCKEIHFRSKYKELTFVLQVNCSHKPSDLAVDWVHDLVYWSCPEDADSSAVTIRCASLSGGDERTVLAASGPVHGLAVDPFQKKLFWMQRSFLKTLKIDGNKAISSMYENTYQFDVKGSSKMAIDVVKQMVYVAGDGQLFKIDFDLTQTDQLILTCPTLTGDLPGIKAMDGQVYQLVDKSNNHSCETHSQTAVHKMSIDLTATKVLGWQLYVPCWVEDECSPECGRPWSQCGCPSGQWITGSGQCSVVSVPVPKPPSPTERLVLKPDSDVSATHLSTERPLKNDSFSGTAKMTITESSTKTQGLSLDFPITPDLSIASNPSPVQVGAEVPSYSDGSTASPDERIKDKVREDIRNADAGSGHMSAVYLIVITIWVAVVVVIVLLRKRRKTGDFSPAHSSRSD